MRSLVSRWRYPLFASLCLGTFLAGTAGGLLHDNGLIADGIAVAGVPLGGLTTDEAMGRLQVSVLPQLPQQLEITHARGHWLLSATKFGRQVQARAAVDEAYALTRRGDAMTRARTRLAASQRPVEVPLQVTVDRQRLEGLLLELKRQVDRQPTNARVVAWQGAGAAEYEAEREGVTVDVAATAARVVAGGQFPPPASVPLVMRRVPAKVTVADLRQTLNTTLATFSTNMADGYYGVMRENRAHNVRLCLERMNGVVLAPGDEFSFNGVVGERLSRDGFKSSIVFQRRADGSIDEEWETGGGICQLATTLFGAALLADQKITDRGNHSKTVHYARVGRDATVYWGVQDLKFANQLQRPVMLWGELDASYDLNIHVVGDARDQRVVELDSSTWYGRSGMGGTLWRSVRDAEGKVLREREWVCDSFYPYDKKT